MNRRIVRAGLTAFVAFGLAFARPALAAVPIGPIRSDAFMDPARLPPAPSAHQTRNNFAFRPTGHVENKLVVFLPGTGSVADSYTDFLRFAADHGYFAIAIDYINDVASEQLCTCNDPCYGDVAEQVVDGVDHHFYDKYFAPGNAPGPSQVAYNSIDMRIGLFLTALINRLDTAHGSEWSQFWTCERDAHGFCKDIGGPAWSKIVVAGHSQGGNLATWILKNKNPDRAIAFSAPSYTLWDPISDESGPQVTHAARSCSPTRAAPHEFTGNTHVANLRAFTNTFDPHYDFGNGYSSALLDLRTLLGPTAEHRLAAGQCPSAGSWLTVSYASDPHGSTVTNGSAGVVGGIPIGQRECIWTYLLH